MPRPPRIQYENAIYHIIARGNRAQDIFLDDADREKFLSNLKDARTKFDLEMFCFALLDNHFHLSLRTRRANLSKAMQWVQTSYSVYFNLRHKATGHLFAGRYRSILVESERYLVALSCYVHLNPVKAGLVKDPRSCRWSSCRAYTDSKVGFNWLSTEVILDLFARQHRKQKSMYRKALKESADSARRIEKTVKRGFLLGGNKFRAEINKRFGIHEEGKPQRKLPVDPEQMIDVVARHFECSKEDVLAGGKRKTNICRDIAIYLIHRCTYLPREDVGKYFGISLRTVANSIKKIRLGKRSGNWLEAEIDAVKRKLPS